MFIVSWIRLLPLNVDLSDIPDCNLPPFRPPFVSCTPSPLLRSSQPPLPFLVILKKSVLTREQDHPTYYHFHIHIVNVALEAGPGQAMSKAFGLENIISQLKHLSPSSSPSSSFSLSRSTITRSQAQDKTESSVPSVAKDEEQNHAQGDDPQGNDDDNDDEAGLANVDMTYVVGEASELWTEVFEPLKRGNKKD